MMTRKRRKLNSDKHFLVELPEASSREATGDSLVSIGEQLPPAEPQVLAVEVSTPTSEKMCLVLVVEPRALAWAQHIVHFLQIG